ncbi:MAG: glycerol kinase, partial [Betaproteobacteria bacterium]|nr:glycerol kinase [Betaproteobacteria bacterium]
MKNNTFLLSLDQGTSSSRSIVFRPDGGVLASAQQELSQIYPQPGWVEHDPQEIWSSQLATARLALQEAGLSSHQIAAVGMTNQRETTLVWRRDTGQAIHNAIVWQDRRTEPACLRLREGGFAALVQQKT